MKKLILATLALLAGAYLWVANGPEPGRSSVAASDAWDSVLREAYENERSDIQVKGTGEVVRILPDDTRGARHQRFVLQLSSGQTLLIAHNTDLAPRVEDLATGDEVTFFGEYEWNEQGGIVHWTHRDPNKRHVGGWLQHEGRTYE